MERRFYLDLAKSGLAMPIGADVILHEHSDLAAALNDGTALGKVFEEAALRYRTPLALPTMDLELEKHWLLELLGVPRDQTPTYHFAGPPGEDALATVRERINEPLSHRMAAMTQAVAYVAHETDLVPVGMCIGPFSLMTKLLSDPIVPIALAGAGITADMDNEVKAVEQVLDMAIRVVLRYVDAQIKAGAKMIFVAEPAANAVYLSPRQIDAGSDIFERYVMKYNLRLRALLAAWDVDLAFHCCGELNDYMVSKFVELEPMILSLGSSRRLWEDARLVPDDIVMFGNLPSKRFFSDADITVEQVRESAAELVRKMDEVGQPFILGTECDVLSVPGHEDTIKAKITAMMQGARTEAAVV